VAEYEEARDLFIDRTPHGLRRLPISQSLKENEGQKLNLKGNGDWQKHHQPEFVTYPSQKPTRLYN
jgi:hypothetical protein